MRKNDTPIPRERLYSAILKSYSNNVQMTARECAVKLYQTGIVKYPLRDTTHPRIVELMKMGKMSAVGSKFDETTRKTVTVYQLAK